MPWRGVEPEPRWHQAASSVALQFQRWRVSLSQCLSPLRLDRRCHCRPPRSGSPMRLLPSAGQSGGLRHCPPHPQVCVVAPCPQSPSVSAREGRPRALIPGFGRHCQVAAPRLEQLLSPGPELEADPGGCSSPSSLPTDIMWETGPQRLHSAQAPPSPALLCGQVLGVGGAGIQPGPTAPSTSCPAKGGPPGPLPGSAVDQPQAPFGLLCFS